MTLVELLVAVGISTLILVAALSIFTVISRSLHRPVEQRRDAAYDALEMIRQDLAACAQSVVSNVPAFAVRTTSPGEDQPVRSDLAFIKGRLPPSALDCSRLETEWIRYSVQAGGNEGGQLIRESMTLWGPDALAPFITNVLLQGIGDFEVSAQAEAGWTNQWKSSSRTLLPKVARIRLAWTAGSTTEVAGVECFIPAGNVIPGTPAASSGRPPERPGEPEGAARSPPPVTGH